MLYFMQAKFYYKRQKMTFFILFFPKTHVYYTDKCAFFFRLIAKFLEVYNNEYKGS